MPGPDSNRRAGWAAAILAVVAILAAVVLLDLGPFADDDLSPSEYVERADEICAEAHADFAELQRTPPRTPADAADLTRELIGVAEEELEQVDSLAVPADLDGDVDRYLAAREEGIATLREGVRAAEAEDPRAYADLQAELARSQPRRTRLARDIGLSECSRSLERPGR